MKWLLAFFFVSLHAYVMAQNKVKFVIDMDSLIQSYIVDNNLPSVSVGVVFQDSIIYGKRIVNFQNNVRSIDNEEKSIYNIASVAKPFVATAIMLLVQDGKINLSDPVFKYLPYFEIDSKFKNEITIEQLLTHTSGLPNVSSPDDYEYIKTNISDQALEKHIRSLTMVKLSSKPGKKYSYSNVGFEILGEVIAKVSKLSFDEFMKVHLFKPLDMKRTSYVLTNYKEREIAQPFISHPYQRTKRFPYNREFSPSGNLFTSIGDMNNWMIFNLNEGHYEDFEPLSNENFNLLTTPRIDTKDGGHIGLSWYVKSTNAGKIIFHDGLDLGYSSLMVLYIEPKIGILILSNHQEVNCNELLNKVTRAIEY